MIAFLFALILQFPVIGVIEGYYGRPWTHEERLEMVAFMGEAGYTHYIHAPKDDPYHRSRWREAYPDSVLARFRETAAAADSAGVRLIYAISPGLSMVYSDPADLEILRAKLRLMRELGFDGVALFFDDVPEDLRHEGDKARYRSLAEAHAHVIRELRKDGELMVCPTTYTDAWGSRAYMRELAAAVPEDVPLFWTGKDVAPSRIQLDDARVWIRDNGIRSPLYLWDNHPVNDYEAWRPILGPVSGRSPRLHEAVSGYFANPMEDGTLNRLPLRASAIYAQDPGRYDPSVAWDLALAAEIPDSLPFQAGVWIELFRARGWEDMRLTGLHRPGTPVDTVMLDRLFALWDAMPPVAAGSQEDRWISALRPYVERNRRAYAEWRERPAPDTLRYGTWYGYGAGRWRLTSAGGNLKLELEPDAEPPAEVLVGLAPDTPRHTDPWLAPADRLVRWRARDGRAEILAPNFTEFTRRGIADIRLYRVTSFFEHAFKPDTSRTVRVDGNRAIVFPKPSGGFRITVSIPPNYQSGNPPMLGNRNTYQRIR